MKKGLLDEEDPDDAFDNQSSDTSVSEQQSTRSTRSQGKVLSWNSSMNAPNVVVEESL